MASHMRPVFAEKGFRLATPNPHDAEETAQECLQGFYRTRSVPGFLMQKPDDIVNGHVTLPRPRDYLRDRRIHSASTAASSGRSVLCSHCDAGRKKVSGQGPPSSTGKRSSGGGSARLTGSAVLSNAGSRSGGGNRPLLGGPASSRPSSERSIGFYNDQRKVEDVPPIRSGLPSSRGGSSICGNSARPSSSASSLQREVEALVRLEMERMVAPLQQQLQQERAGRQEAEEKIKALSSTPQP